MADNNFNVSENIARRPFVAFNEVGCGEYNEVYRIKYSSEKCRVYRGSIFSNPARVFPVYDTKKKKRAPLLFTEFVSLFEKKKIVIRLQKLKMYEPVSKTVLDN